MLESRPFDPDATASVPPPGGAWRRVALTLAISLLALGAIAAAADAAPRRAEIRRAAEAVLSNGEFQQAHPQAEPEPEEIAPPPEAPSASHEGGGPPTGLANIVKILLWTLALVGGALIIAFLVHELLPFVRRAKGMTGEDWGAAPATNPGAPDPMEPPSTLADAEGLAGQGLYGEAIHALLLACLEELRRRFDPGQPPSLTSREIARRLSLSEGAKAALASIVAAAELSHFGVWRPGASDYAACLDDYRQVAAEPEAAV